MASIKYKLGDLICLRDERNSDLKYSLDDVKGISIQKVFIETKADMTGVSLRPYILVKPDYFAYVTVTSRNGEKITLAHADTENTYIVSSSYVVFNVSRPDILLSDYLFMYFNRPEFDRFVRFNSWGSARETFSWEDMCDIDIELPDLAVQKKCVDVYNAMLANQRSYERGLDDLRLVCDAHINNLDYRHAKPIRDYIERNVEKNQDGLFAVADVKGFNNDGDFIKPMRLFQGEISTFKIIRRNCFVYNSRVNSTIKKLSIALNEGDDLIVTPAYESFYVSKPDELHPYYLYMLLQREGFARKVLFNSFGSATLFFDIDALGDLRIPVPDIEVQRSISNIYKAYRERKAINERLKALMKDLCAILIKGSLEDAFA